MLVIQNGKALDSGVCHFPDYLTEHDVVVFNDTRVIPARLLGKRGDAKVEILLHKQTMIPTSLSREGIVWTAFAKPAKRLKIGDRIIFALDFSCEVISKQEDGQIVVQFEAADFTKKLLKYGHMPLPPYIEKKRKAESVDSCNYQTVYAIHDGSVAAPTAGLHFTPQLLQAIDAKGAKRVHVTLHVGGGTFLPVKVDDTDEHIMHSEWAEVSAEAAATINTVKERGGRVFAVGTTSLRTLESATDATGQLQPFSGETNIFITPGYRFKMVDGVLTNFHLPKSTLFMLVSAFSGLKAMREAYNHAIQQQYRFYSYGDTCLLFPQKIA